MDSSVCREIFREIRYAKFQKTFPQSRGKVAANDILVLPRHCRNFCRVFASTSKKFCRDFAVTLPQIL
jgi:hypothetical protein